MCLRFVTFEMWQVWGKKQRSDGAVTVGGVVLWLKSVM